MSPLSVGRSGSCFVAPWSRCRYCDCESGSLADGRTERPLEAPLATTIPCGSSRRRRPVRRWAARPVMPRSARLSRLRIPIPERRAWRPLSFALAPSETERSSADEDDDAEADQDDGEQDVFPALEDFSDRRPGGNELGDYDQEIGRASCRGKRVEHGGRVRKQKKRLVRLSCTSEIKSN